METTQRLLISGRVQQVGYRDFAVRSARALGLTGWVRNLRDGRVEIVAQGEEAALTDLVEACRHGPRLADVAHIEAQQAEEKAVKGFTKRFTV
ncbi:MAG: acylphosphatase [Sphingomonas sp.]